MGTVAGIDISGRTTGTTAIAFLSTGGRGKPKLGEIIADGSLRGDAGDETIAKLLLRRRPDITAIDAPLTLPHPAICRDPDCRRCFGDPQTRPRYTSRECDLKQSWVSAGFEMSGPMPTVMIAAIAFRAIYLRRVLERSDIKVIETWPMGVYRALEKRQGLDHETQVDDARRLVLLRAAIAAKSKLPETGTDVRDRLDAVAAAYTAWSYANGAEHVISVPERIDTPANGEIWIPRPEAR